MSQRFCFTIGKSRVDSERQRYSIFKRSFFELLRIAGYSLTSAVEWTSSAICGHFKKSSKESRRQCKWSNAFLFANYSSNSKRFSTFWIVRGEEVENRSRRIAVQHNGRYIISWTKHFGVVAASEWNWAEQITIWACKVFILQDSTFA